MLALTPDTESVGSWSHPLYSRSPPCSPLAGLPISALVFPLGVGVAFLQNILSLGFQGQGAPCFHYWTVLCVLKHILGLSPK